MCETDRAKCAWNFSVRLSYGHYFAMLKQILKSNARANGRHSSIRNCGAKSHWPKGIRRYVIICTADFSSDLELMCCPFREHDDKIDDSGWATEAPIF